MGTHWAGVHRELKVDPALAHLFAPDEGSKERPGRRSPASGKGLQANEELPYRIELWNAEKTAVEQVLAVTASASIGQAAFYAAAREYVERYVTLRHKQAVINRWNGPSH